MGKFFLEIGLDNEQIHVGGRCITKNGSSARRDTFNWTRGLRNMSQNLNLKRDYWELQKIYFMKKVGGKALDWCYIGPEWRKVAEIG